MQRDEIAGIVEEELGSCTEVRKSTRSTNAILLGMEHSYTAPNQAEIWNDNSLVKRGCQGGGKWVECWDLVDILETSSFTPQNDHAQLVLQCSTMQQSRPSHASLILKDRRFRGLTSLSDSRFIVSAPAVGWNHTRAKWPFVSNTSTLTTSCKPLGSRYS